MRFTIDTVLEGMIAIQLCRYGLRLGDGVKERAIEELCRQGFLPRESVLIVEEAWKMALANPCLIATTSDFAAARQTWECTRPRTLRAVSSLARQSELGDWSSDNPVQPGWPIRFAENLIRKVKCDADRRC